MRRRRGLRRGEVDCRRRGVAGREQRKRGEGSRSVRGFIGRRLWHIRKGIGALAESVAFLACAGDRRVAVQGSAITGARKGRSAGKERKGIEAVLTCGAGLQREGEATRAGG